jgi:hypothetical protein
LNAVDLVLIVKPDNEGRRTAVPILETEAIGYKEILLGIVEADERSGGGLVRNGRTDEKL